MEVILPNLPGYKPSHLPLIDGDRRNFRKTTLTYLRGYAIDETPVHADLLPPPEPVKPAQPSSSAPENTMSRSAVLDGTKGPKWVQNDRKVLRWFGYFKEDVPESAIENFRVRKIVICHYLADDTTDVMEPRQNNSGLWQGTFIKRHKIPKADGSPLTPEDIRVAESLAVYGHVFHIVDADEFTRGYMSEQGINLKEREPYPEDPYEMLMTQRQRQVEEGKPEMSESMRGSTMTLGRLQQYLLNSKKVLRFYCIWDDRQRMFGDRRPFCLHFYLEDHTCEILEVHEQNSGRDHFPVFLRRCQLPKDPTTITTGKALDHSLCFGVEDFRIGTFLHIYGRDLYIHDCDDFTRAWMQENMGYSEEEMAPVDVSEPVPSGRTSTLPPFNGFGTLKDSAGNCNSLVPKAPRKDFYKLMNRGQIVLRFGAQFQQTPQRPVSEENRDRQFVLSYFMADDTISIFEPRNNGFEGGKYLERGQVPKGQNEGVIMDKDLHVGASLSIYGHAFLLHNADEFTLQLMENHRHEYQEADWQRALETVQAHLNGKLESLRTAIIEVDREGTGQLSLEGLEEVLRLVGVQLSKHQVISIQRRLSKGTSSTTLSVEALIQVLQQLCG